jgi:hypothetical protein
VVGCDPRAEEAARAQQGGLPVIGYLESRSPDGMTDRLRGFRDGLKDSGYVERENVAIEYRWAENQLDRLARSLKGSNPTLVAKTACR